MRLLILVAFALAVRVPDADACSCKGPRFEVSPGGTDVPFNARVMVWMHKRHATPDLRFGLRAKGGKLVAVDTQQVDAADTIAIEIVPRAPLATQTRYEVVAIEKRSVTVAGTFTTNTSRQTTAPKWSPRGVDALLIKPKYWGTNCVHEHPHISVLGIPKGSRVAMWVGPKPDYTKPPHMYFEIAGYDLLLGNASYCSPANFTIPTTSKLVLGFKLLDVAGNASDASEVTVDTRTPVVM